ncbi:MarR family transcriptional regulator [Bacillus altitudinis]|uniref:MarR family transcriptional regulator n=1 Tax=Bacillus altitudinis TaxID=293387 RepID=UPI002D767C2F|nr:MarR family transcriptional regulator [Bacillus altitudinis]WRO24211.1 MarR family transcriptional regulator [Bacillus altitudinis]
MDKKQIEQYIDTYSQIMQSISISMQTIQKDSFKNSIITPDQFNLMNIINTSDTCTSSFLAKVLNVKKSTITAIVNRLSDKGLVTRISKENDRRVIMLKLTEQGQFILEKERKNLFNKLMPLGNTITEDEFENLRKNITLIDLQLKTIIKGVNKDEN